MGNATASWWQELVSPLEFEQLRQRARQRRWGLALVLIGWLHLLAFSFCYFLTIACDYHQAAGYLAIWVGELLGVGVIYRLCAGSRTADTPAPPAERFLVRIWVAYFLLAFNLGTMNTLRGHKLFELFPAMASLASFAFLVMTFAISRRFFAAVLVMFASGLVMAAYLLHAYLTFALAWWLVLNGIGLGLWWSRDGAACRRAAGGPLSYKKERGGCAHADRPGWTVVPDRPGAAAP
jgi:hypothetical protein